MVVLGLAVFIVVVFGVLAGVTNIDASGPANSGVRPATVPGTSLVAVSATRALRPIEQAGEPPGNSVDAVRIPVGAVVVSSANNTAGAGEYDEQVTFAVAASQSAVIDFFRTEVRRLGWGQYSSGPAYNEPATIEVLATKGGNDGFYWEIGALVSPTTFAKNGVLSTSKAAATTGTTRFTIRLFQVSDTN